MSIINIVEISVLRYPKNVSAYELPIGYTVSTFNGFCVEVFKKTRIHVQPHTISQFIIPSKSFVYTTQYTSSTHTDIHNTSDRTKKATMTTTYWNETLERTWNQCIYYTYAIICLYGTASHTIWSLGYYKWTILKDCFNITKTLSSFGHKFNQDHHVKIGFHCRFTIVCSLATRVYSHAYTHTYSIVENCTKYV